MKITLFGLSLLAACGPSEPHWESRCLASHTEQQLVYWPSEAPAGGFGVTPMGGGVHMGGGMHLVTTTVCTRSDSVWVTPPRRGAA